MYFQRLFASLHDLEVFQGRSEQTATHKTLDQGIVVLTWFKLPLHCFKLNLFIPCTILPLSFFLSTNIARQRATG